MPTPLILCRRPAEAMAALRRITAWGDKNCLTRHPDQTRIGDCRQPGPGPGVAFLAYRLEAGRRLGRKQSLTALKDKGRAKTGRPRAASLGRIIADRTPTRPGAAGSAAFSTPRRRCSRCS